MSFSPRSRTPGSYLLWAVLAGVLGVALLWSWTDDAQRDLSEAALGVEAESHASDEVPPEATEPTSLPSPGDPANEDEASTRSALPDPPLTAIAVTVHHEDGRPAPFATVHLLRGGIEEFLCDDQGRALIPVEPDTYDLWLPCGWEDAIAINAPEGRSSAEVVVGAGERAEVDLILYREATLHCRFLNHAGAGERVQSARLFTRIDGRWAEQVDRGPHSDGSITFGRLTEGTYCLAPGDFTFHWFEPEVVELLRGERKSITVTCAKPRAFQLEVRARAEPDGPSLPIWMTVQASPIGDWDVPLPARFTTLRGRTVSPTEVWIDLLPGPARLDFWSTSQVGNCTQIVPYWHWAWDVRVPGEGPLEPSTFELVLDTFGELATVTGKVEGARERERGYHAVKYTEPNGGEHSLILRPDREDETFRMVVDLGLVENRTLELLEVVGTRWTAVESRVLIPGEQPWIITAGGSTTSKR